jgi:hypothetical protein
MHSVGARAFCAKRLNKIHEYLFLWNNPALIEYSFIYLLNKSAFSSD